MSEGIESVVEVIRSHSSFLLTTHVNPEGDAIGSEVALALGLEKLGKEVYVFNQDPVPYFLEFLRGSELVKTTPPNGTYEVAILLDCGSPERTGVVGGFVESFDKLVCIDHHITNGGYGDSFYVVPEASSTGELVCDLLECLEVDIDIPIGEAIWVAIATDTGWFRYSNTTERSLDIAKKLLSLGVKPWDISEKMYGNDPPERFRLLSRILSNMELVAGGKVAGITIRRKDMEEFGATFDYLEGFINYPRSIKGVLVAVSFREEDDGRVKVSLRSKGDVRVDEFAARFGGGGHEKAAGFTLAGNVDDVKKITFEKLEEMLSDNG